MPAPLSSTIDDRRAGRAVAPISLLFLALTSVGPLLSAETGADPLATIGTEAELWSHLSGARYAEVLQLLRDHPHLIHSRHADGDGLLHKVAVAGRAELVRQVMRGHVDPYLRNTSGKMAQELLRPGDPIDTLIGSLGGIPRETQTPKVRWQGTTVTGLADLELQVLDKGRRFLDLPDRQGRTPLSYACQFGDRELVTYLLDQQVRVDLPDRRRTRPLHFAAQRGDPVILRALIEAGAELHTPPDRKHRTYRPLIEACRRGRLEAARYLLSRGSSPRIGADDRSYGPLAAAAMSGNLLLIDELLAAGADPTMMVGRHPPLQAACQSPHATAVLARLLDRVPAGRVDSLVGSNGSPLHMAVQHRKIEVAFLLLDHGFKAESKDRKGGTFLHHAIRTLTPVQFRQLLADPRVKAVINQPDSYGWTPLDVATSSRREDLVTVLRTAGGEARVPAAFFQAFAAIDSADLGRLEKLLAADPEILRLATREGLTLLTRAVAKANITAITTLCRAGAAIDQTNERGQTAATALLQIKDPAQAEATLDALLEAGGELNRLDPWDATLLDQAQRSRPDLVPLLKERGAITGQERIRRMLEDSYGANDF